MMRTFSENVVLDEQIAARYPRTIAARGDKRLTLTPLVPSDWPMLEEFIAATPDDERRFFRHDLSDPDRVERWCQQLDYRHMLPLLAWSGETIAADAVLQLDPGLWTSHVGEVRMLVHPDFRRRGIASAMLRELVAVADELGLHKLSYQCAADQSELIGLLEHNGFHAEARLPQFIRDSAGRLHDMMIYVFDLG